VVTPAIDRIVDLCRGGLDSVELRQAVARALRQVVPFDAWCIATVDPATLLVTGGVSEGLPLSELGRIAELEYFSEDVNKFSALARSATPVRTLREATRGQPERSRRYRELLAPRGWVDELRAALVVDGQCWGAMGLFRGPGEPAFSRAEAKLIARLGAHLAEGLRVALLVGSDGASPLDGEEPGLIVLDDQLGVDSLTPAARRWLAELPNAAAASGAGSLPDVVYVVAARVRAPADVAGSPEAALARARVQARSGRWLVLHGSRLVAENGTPARVAVIVEAAPRPEIAPLIVQAYGLSAREQEVLRQVLRGTGSAEMARLLGISPLTVQDHLKAIFRKLGVRSRREVVARFLADQYFPRVQAGTPIGANGWFRT
jgi:DNA-binding CsgD family transcriptional regulator